tara:strand:- start:2696 stop:2848 length:153 start_codon:yes stop_codon:yes gene_type:complete
MNVSPRYRPYVHAVGAFIVYAIAAGIVTSIVIGVGVGVGVAIDYTAEASP